MKTRKTNGKTIQFITVCLLLCLSLCSCQVFFQSNNLPQNPNKDNPSNNLQIHEFRLTNKICEAIFGINSQTFYKTKGEGTLLENGYTDVSMTDNETLILKLTDSQLNTWKNSIIHLQILQKILGDEKEIVSQVIVPTDLLYGTLYEDADIHCGFEISEDFSRVIAGPGDDKSYYLIVPKACLLMQFFQGVPSDKISVEYIEVNAAGSVISRANFPAYMSIFQDLEECKLLKQYEQTPAEIYEYTTPNADGNYKGLEYKSFWGMKYRSSFLEYEIFAYEFTSKDNALKYYVEVTGNDRHLEKLPVEDSDKNHLGEKSFGKDKYQIVVVKGNYAYTLSSSNSFINEIEKMISEVFSVKI